MAIDSQAKRMSAAMLVMPCYPVTIVPSGAVTEADRQAAAWIYMGIAALAVYAEVRLYSITIDRPDFALAIDRPTMKLSVDRPSFTIVVHHLLE